MLGEKVSCSQVIKYKLYTNYFYTNFVKRIV